MDDLSELDALGYLQGVYRGKFIAEGQRMKAAMAALPFERPKLAVTATLDGRGFAEQMEEIARKSGRSYVIDAKGRYDTSEPLKIEVPRPVRPELEPDVTDPAEGFKRRL